MLKLPALFS